MEMTVARSSSARPRLLRAAGEPSLLQRLLCLPCCCGMGGPPPFLCEVSARSIVTSSAGRRYPALVPLPSASLASWLTPDEGSAEGGCMLLPGPSIGHF